MAYNKTKHLDTAQKNLNQGKVSLAIEDYKAILKHEPRDQATLMTIGDLFVRQGETFQALEYFERLAQIFLAEGFVAKAIAIYKKIAKLAPEQTRPIERLAELYVQQGVLSEARPIYLHLAEQHQRAGRNPQAAALLRKLLEAEPDSPRVQTRLAELCLAMSQPAEAAEAYRTAAEHLHRRGDHAEAIQFADRAMETNPGDLPASVLKARAMIGIGQRSQAIALLKSLPQAGPGNEAADLLLDLYLEDAEYERASELAEKILAGNSRRFSAAHRVVEALLDARQAESALPLLDSIRETMTHLGEHETLSQSLTQAAEQLPGRIEPREWLVQLYQQASDSFRLPDALADLAAALEAAGRYDRARKVYEQILERDPENEAARRNYEAALSRMGPESAAPEPDVLADAPAAQPAAAASGEPALDEATQHFVTQSLTDVDLFSSYGLTQKAIDLLEVVLERAPRHVPSMERLLDFYLGAGNERRTAELASQLQQILSDRGDLTGAERFEQLHRRFERAAGLSPGESAIPPPAPVAPPVASPTASPEAAAPVAPQPASVPEPAAVRESVPASASTEIDAIAQALDAEITVHEVDLSEEWAALAGEIKTAASPFLESIAENLAPQAEAEEVAAPQAVESGPPPQDSGVAAEPPAVEEPAAERETAAALPEQEPGSGDDTTDVPVYTLNFDLVSDAADTPPGEDAFAVEPVDAQMLLSGPGPRITEPEPAQPTPAEPPVAESAAMHASTISEPSGPPRGKDFLQVLSSELNAALPASKEPPDSDEPPRLPAAAASAASAAPAAPASSLPAAKEPAHADHSAAGPLSDLFDDFRAELEAIAEDEDPETHYNLGVAYREMGLLEEAISEFQKVAKAGNGFAAFRYAMQCCTLLGLSFMEKGQPLIAAMWYERALEIPGLDQETILALRYDLGVAQELAGETAAARKSFSQVYGMNIDYRDVAERLAALGKGS